MSIYRVHIRHDGYESSGYKYFSKLADAKKCFKECKEWRESYDTIEKFKTPKTKKDVLDLLNYCGTHPDNG